MNNTVLCIGSNTHNRGTIISDVVARFGKIMHNMQQSSVYECASHSGIGSPYYNTVVKCDTTLTYEQLRSLTKELEREMGRTPQSKETGVMPLDIDIVLWNDKIMHPHDYEHYHFKHGYEQIIPHQ
jgi:2-amino-4-hydroxy-6-hydroxymethyldihydropteridine diphosphokinase